MKDPKYLKTRPEALILKEQWDTLILKKDSTREPEELAKIITEMDTIADSLKQIGWLELLSPSKIV